MHACIKFSVASSRSPFSHKFWFIIWNIHGALIVETVMGWLERIWYFLSSCKAKHGRKGIKVFVTFIDHFAMTMMTGISQVLIFIQIVLATNPSKFFFS